MPVRLRAALGVAGALVAGFLLWRLGAVGWAMATAIEAQRALQGALAGAARALARGDAGAVWSLAGLSALYGVAHAARPGHGKALLGAAAVAGAERPLGLAALAAAAALAQGLAAVVIVYGGLAVLSLSPIAAMTADATVFAPIGYAAAGAFGLLFAWRGLRALAGRGEACCGHHAPLASPRRRWRERAALVAAVAARPCAGAMIVLAIASMAKAPWAGVAGAGTARVAGGLQVAAGGVLCAFAAAGLA